MLEVKKEGVILQKNKSGFEHEGVMNPGVILVAGTIHMFYRAVGKGNHSSIGYCQLETPLKVTHRHDTPLLFPQFEYESQGLEDPRIVRIDDLYYLSYTAYDGINALGAMATSRDLIHFEKQGVITPQISFEAFSRLASAQAELNQKYERYNNHALIREVEGKRVLLWDKNLIFFPRRIQGKLYFMHRIKPDIQISSVTELSELTDEYWQSYFLHLADHIALMPRYKHEVSYIGGGCPPIETEKGWLLIYHAVHDTVEGYVYTACAALMQLDHPLTEIARLPYPLFGPEFPWELEGAVSNVCFPTGCVVVDDRLYIYYGAADESIACASMSLSQLLEELIQNPVHNAH